MRYVLTGIAALALSAWSTVLYAWVADRQRRNRQQAIVALNALRRRHDRELTAIRAHLGIEAPQRPEPWQPAEPADLPPIRPFGDSGPVRPSPFPHEPATEPIPAQPATVPTLAKVDEWEAKMHADFEAAMAKIRETT